MTTPNIPQIAGSLSKAQREGFSGDDWWHCDGRVTNGLHRKGLIDRPDYRGVAPYTPLGLALRAHILQEQEK